jgi:hypothetical protein
MGQSKILIDSCSYFRLAQSLHPLLNNPFGEKKYSFYLNDYMITQYEKNPRLKNKFLWVKDIEYLENRKNKLNLSASDKKNIEMCYEYIAETTKDLKLYLHYDDIYCLAYSYELNIPVVSDDSGMHKVAGKYDIKIMSTLKLIRLMFDEKFIDDLKIKEIVEYWEYNNDKPKYFHRDFKRLFPNISLDK